MKNKMKILGIVIAAAALLSLVLFQIVPALADAPGPLDHVQLTPTTATMAPGATQQFVAQGFDAANASISGLNYFWMVTAGGGTISTTGVFTAGTTTGTYTNTVQAVVVQGSTVKIANATVVITGTAGALDHVVVSPSTATVVANGTQQFSAQGYDVNNIAIAGLTYTWSVTTAGGSINPTSGLFTAGTTVGNFSNIVQASATEGMVIKAGTANVIISTTPTPMTTTPTPKTDTQRLIRMFTGLFNSTNFDNFLGGQWQVKNGTGVDTVKAIPGLVQAVSATSLTVLPNGQTAPTTLILSTSTTILPKGTQLAVNDKVVVVTVNDQVTMVVENVSPTGQLPPGTCKNDKNREGKSTPSGWSKGNKDGWNNGVSGEKD